MIAVIVVPGPAPGMHGLDEQAPLSLLPLGDRPILQHLVEFLALQGVRSFEFIVDHAPERVENHFGDGGRWGCRFRYHLTSQPTRPYRSLQTITSVEPLLLVHADRFPYIRFDRYVKESQPVFFRSEPGDVSPGEGFWGGAVVLPSGTLTSSLINATRPEFEACLHRLEEQGSAKAVTCSEWVDTTTPAGLLTSQQQLLDHAFKDLMIGGAETDPGVWISRNVVMHPSVKVTAPVYLGPNCRLGEGVEVGPYAVILGNSIIDNQTSVRNSLVTGNSYVGQRLELDGVIVDRNLLVNSRLGTGVAVSESFLLGALSEAARRSWFSMFFEPLVAVALLALFLPFFLVTAACLWPLGQGKPVIAHIVELPTSFEPRAWRTWPLPYFSAVPWDRHIPAGWTSFFCRFIPGLVAVAVGKLSLVGLPPRTLAQMLALPRDWRSLYASGKAGLISEAALTTGEQASEMELYFAEACYTANHKWNRDLPLFLHYFSRLVFRPQALLDPAPDLEVELSNSPADYEPDGLLHNAGRKALL